MCNVYPGYIRGNTTLNHRTQGSEAAELLAALLPAYAFANLDDGAQLPGFVRVHLGNEVDGLLKLIHSARTLMEERFENGYQ